jgi:hypothetical protein
VLRHYFTPHLAVIEKYYAKMKVINTLAYFNEELITVAFFYIIVSLNRGKKCFILFYSFKAPAWIMEMEARGLCYKTFFHNLRMGKISLGNYPGKPFQTSLMLASKVKGYLRACLCATLL